MTEREYIHVQALTNLRTIEHLLRDTMPFGCLTDSDLRSLTRAVALLREGLSEGLALDIEGD